MGVAPVLKVLQNGAEIKSCPIEGDAVVGREEGCLIRLEDRAVSRKHAVFRKIGEGIQVEKKSDFGPLIVNGAECTSAVLKEGDLISIGPYLLKLAMDEKDNEATVTATTTETMESQPEEAAATILMAQSSKAQEPQENPENNPPVESAQSIETVQFPEGTASEQVQEGLLVDTTPMPLSESLQVNDQPPGDLGFPSPSPPFHFESPAEIPIDSVSAENASPSSLEGLDPISLGDPNEHLGLAKSDATVALGPIEIPTDLSESANLGVAEPDAPTQAASPSKIAATLAIPAGAANVTQYKIDKDEIVIGRGKACDIVLVDKKASRQSAKICRIGNRFVIKDAGSSNGTFLNGKKVSEHELFGDDVIRIGETEIVFGATSKSYAAKMQNFIAVQGNTDGLFPRDSALNEVRDVPSPNTQPIESDPSKKSAPLGIPGIAGILASGPAQKKSKSIFLDKLRDKFRKLPRRQQWLVIAIIVLGIMYSMQDEDADVAPKKKTKTAAVPGPSGGQVPPSFDKLTPEQKKFVETQHALAFDYYRNKEYDKALFEIGKIFSLVPDYKNSREIEQYAKDGKKKLEALEEERRRKEEDARLKQKVAQLVGDVRTLMAQKRFDEAKDQFSQILALDPENPAVAEYKKELDDYEEQLKIRDEQRQVKDEINQRGWEIYLEGLKLEKLKKQLSALMAFKKIIEMGADDPTLLKKSRSHLQKMRAAIAAVRGPLIAQGKESESSGDFVKAYDAYRKAQKADPSHPEPRAGIERIRGILHIRAKESYTEAVLAESYSDFATARKKYKECIDAAPEDDVYHERAERKLAHIFKKDEPQSQ